MPTTQDYPKQPKVYNVYKSTNHQPVWKESQTSLHQNTPTTTNNQPVWREPQTSLQQNTPTIKEYATEKVTTNDQPVWREPQTSLHQNTPTEKVTSSSLSTKDEETLKMSTYNVNNVTPDQKLKITSSEVTSLPTITNYNAYKLNIPDIRNYKLSGITFYFQNIYLSIVSLYKL